MSPFPRPSRVWEFGKYAEEPGVIPSSVKTRLEQINVLGKKICNSRVPDSVIEKRYIKLQKALAALKYYSLL